MSFPHFPVISEEDRKKSFADLFAPGLIWITLIITLAYFLQITTYYFILKWTPKVFVDMGFYTLPTEQAC